MSKPVYKIEYVPAVTSWACAVLVDGALMGYEYGDSPQDALSLACADSTEDE